MFDSTHADGTARRAAHLGRIALAALIVWSLVACGVQGGTGANEATPTTAATALATPAPSGTPTPDPHALLVSLNRSGGIAGLDETYRIQLDGGVTLNATSAQHPQGASAAQQLAEQIAATGIYEVAPGKYQPEVVCCDLFSYNLTLYHNGETYQYITSDGIEDAPPEVFAVSNLVQQFVREALE